METDEYGPELCCWNCGAVYAPKPIPVEEIEPEEVYG